MVLWFDRTLLDHIEMKENAEAQLILESADDPYNLVDSDGNNLLHHAAIYDNDEMTKYLIDSGTLIDVQNKDGKTPLILGMKHCNTVDLLETLLDANASINVCDKAGISPLYLAVNGVPSYRLWRKFLNRLEIEYSFNYEEITDVLIKIGCDLYDAMYVGCAEITKIILRRGSDPNEIFNEGKTALHCAVVYMHLENVKLLVEHGADVNVVDDDGKTPVGYLGLNYDTGRICDILKVLLDGGAKMFIPEETTGSKNQFKYILTFGKNGVIRLLMKYDFNLNILNDRGMTAVHDLALNLYPGVLREIRDKGFDVNVKNESNVTPLCFAIENPSSVKFLLDRGANANAADDEGIRPLMRPFKKNIYGLPVESIELLLQYGADIKMVCLEEETIFDAAVEKDRLMFIEPVLAHLAMLRANGKPVPPIASERISAHPVLQERFDLYVHQIEKMKNITVFQSITLHNLLIDSEDKIVRYMNNEELVLKLSRLSSKCGLTSYYHKCLRKRLTEAMQIAKLKEGAATVLCKMIGLSYSANFVIIDRIIHYLSCEDMKVFYYIYT